MSEARNPSGPQFHADRPQEQEAVRTTIVGGRPPGSGKSIGNIPRGIEVLVKKAAVDPAFKSLLLDRRAAAADEIGLKLEPAEAMMLAAAPREQLETVIANTQVPEEHRRAFLGKVAAVMLLAVGGAAVAGMIMSAGSTPSKGIRPGRSKSAGIDPKRLPPEERPVEPPPLSKEVRPDQWPAPEVGREKQLDSRIIAGIGSERSIKRDLDDGDQSNKSPKE